MWLRDDAVDNGVEPFTGPVSWLSPDIELLDLTPEQQGRVIEQLRRALALAEGGRAAV